MPTVKHHLFHPRHGIAVVKQGFSWPAFLFGSLWALARRIHPLFFAMLVLDVVLWFVSGHAGAHGSFGWALLGLFGTLAYAIVRGLYGNRWVESYLLSKGYVLRSDM